MTGILPLLAALFLGAIAHAQPANSILREVFQGIGGSSVSDLTNSAAYPLHPSATNYVSDFFEAPTDVDDNYGQRMHGYVIPPVSGNYTFWISSDDGSTLYLSTDDSPANAKAIAYVSSWTSPREWTKEANQQSVPIKLEAGRGYYVSALQKEGGGGDNLAVRWLRPDGVDEGPIPAKYLQPWGTVFTPPQITGEPADTSAIEGQLASFTVVTKNFDAATQWKKNGAPIPGAIGPTLSFGPVTVADDQAKFSATLTNKLGSVATRNAILTVLPDTTPPAVVGAINQGNASILVVLSEPVADASGSADTNYKVDGGISVTAAVVQADHKSVLLSVSTLTYGTAYTVTVNGVQDRANVPNAVPANSHATFTAREFVSQDVGTTGGSIERIDAASWNLKGGGTDIGGTADQFQYGWEQRTGNFDVQVRVAAEQVSDPFVHAGLMARASLAANAAFAGVFAASPQVGSFLESRATTGATAATFAPVGGFPVNPPQTWLRLKRAGTTFTGYGSFDGQTWVQLGTTTVTLPSTFYFGLVLSGGTATQLSAAQFRDYGPTATTTVGTYAPSHEPLGPASRRTGLVFSEIMYHARPAGDAGRQLEFVELYNADTIFEDLGGWRISGDIDFTFPAGYVLPAGEFVAIAANPTTLGATGATRLLGPYSGTLSHGSGTLRLIDEGGVVRLEFSYDSRPPWPVAADGTGHSLALVRPSYGLADPRAWGTSEQVGGSPGRFDTVFPNPQSTVSINEFLANPEPPQPEFLELYNHSNAAVDLSGCFLSDDPSTNKFRIPDGTSIAARGFLSFDRTQLGFGLSSAGESLFLVSSNQTRVVDAVLYGPQERNVASGRSPDGSDSIRRLSAPTAGQPNAAWRVEDIVINELMYAPISGDSDDEFIELFNRGANAVDLSDWRLSEAVTLKIPDGTILAAGGYLVLGRNVDRLRANYPQLNAANTLGNYSGSLGNSGDHVALTKPQLLVGTNTLGDVVTNKVHCVVSEVTYVGGGKWGKYSSGGGSSMELVDPHGDLLRPSSWADSDESQKSAWKTYSVTGVLAQGTDGYPPNRLHVGMLGMGETLVDDVEVVGPGGSNQLSNPGFESGTTAWTFFGNHSTSGVDATGGATGPRCLHIRGQGDNDTANNCIRTPITGTLNPGDKVTLRVKARWIAGWPEILLRVHGNWMELAARLDLPSNLGSPGLPNSRLVANAGPAIHGVTHSPALPRANQAVVVTARVSDPDGIATVNLRYRVDPSTTATTVAMRDDGTGGDAVAGDGIWSGTIPGRASGTLVAFTVNATDTAAGGAATASFPPTGQIPFAKPATECHVRWDDPIPAGNFAHYHLWNTSANEALRTVPLNNTYREATLVYGNFRVIYQSGFRDKGSPYHGGAGSYASNNPDDEPLLGTTERVFRSTGNGGSESTGLRNVTSAWIGRQLGIPYLHAHYMQLYRNGGQQYNISEDEEVPSNEYARGQFPAGGSGDLYKIALWFEFDDSNSGFTSTHATLEDFRDSTGAPNRARYRWTWQTRGYQGSANNYSNIFNLVRLANDTSADFVPNLLREVDVDEWMRIFAYHRVLGNWDSYTFSVGQNMYLFKQPVGRYVLMPWDIDFTLGDGNGPSDGLAGGQDPIVNRWYDTPALRRMLWRAYQDAVNGPMDPARSAPIIEARRLALAKNNIQGLSAPTGVTSYLAARRAYILAQLQGNDVAAFKITTSNGQNFDSAQPVATLEGTAPFAVASILVNGVEYPTVWTSQNTYSIVVPLGATSNVLALVGVDRAGKNVPGGSATITVRYTGVLQNPQDYLVLNEIHYNPIETNASFVEIYNNSTTTPFDLSGWRLEGVGLTFADGTVLGPAAYGVVAKDRAGLAAAYGPGINVLAEYPGNLSNGGENLRLVKPLGIGGTNDLVVSDVRYDQSPPWPTYANGFGPSLQLIDPTRGAYRVANWATTATNSPDRATPGRVNATKAALPAFANLWINEVLPNNVGGPVDGAGEHDPYIELYNGGPNTVILSSYSISDSYTNLARGHFPVGTSVAAGKFVVLWADGQAAQSTATEFHTDFRINPTNGIVALSRVQLGGSAVLDHVDYRLAPAGRSIGLVPDGEPRGRRSLFHPTVGTPNDPAFPRIQVTINEFLAGNTSTLVNPVTGKADDWFEFFNAGTDAVDFTGYTLTNDPLDPAKFTIPSGFVAAPSGYLLAWADKTASANKTNPPDLHVSFKLAKTGGFLALFGPDGALVDSINYGSQSTDISQGRFPDGGDLPLATFTSPTPRASNGLAGGNQAPVLALIPPLSVVEQQLLAFTAQATDPDAGQTLSYSLGVDAPAGAEIEAATGKFTWTPTEEQGPGTYSFAVRATDNGTPPRTAAQRATVTVGEANRAPVLPPIGDRSVGEGTLIAIDAAAADPDVPANTLAYSLAPGAPAGARIDPATGQFVWTPSEEQGPGSYPITIVVVDNGTPPLSNSRTFVVGVTEVDNPPVLDAIAPQAIDEGKTLSVTAHAVDPDQPPSGIAYTLEGNLPAGIEVDPASGKITWTPTETQGPGTYIIVVRATEQDGQHLSSTRSFGITVNEANQPPVLGPLPTLTVREGDPAVFTATASDPDFPLQGLLFTLGANVPAGATIDPQTGFFSWTTPDDVGNSTNHVTVNVNDVGPGTLGDSGVATVVTTPRFRAVINEILYRPDATNTAFVELYNPSAITSQSLAGVVLAGENLRYTFPAGAKLDPGKFLVVAQNKTEFAKAFGAVPVFAEWTGTLDRFGTRLALQRPDPAGGFAILQQVDFRASLPWPTNSDKAGTSLQLVDAKRDGTRVANWAAATATGWKHVVQAGTASTSKLYLYLENAGEAYVDDVTIVAGTDPEAGANVLPDGDFEGPFPGNFTVSDNLSGSGLSTSVRHGGKSSLHLVSTAAGTTQGSSVWQVMAPDLAANAPYVLSYWYLPNPAGGTLTIRLSGSGIKSTVNLVPDGAATAGATPGTTNSVAAVLPEFPPVWINEIASDNRTGLADFTGKAQPWVELINAGPLPVDLSGWWLSSGYTNLGAWTFPPGSTIPANGFLVVFADAPATTPPAGELHAGFRLNPAAGSVALSRPQPTLPAVVDYLEYAAAKPDASFGRDPRGFPYATRAFPVPTPNAPNALVVVPVDPPVIVASVAANGTVALQWTTVPGTTYRVETRDHLADAWQPLKTFVADGATTTVTDPSGGRTERYYRVVVP